MYFVALLPAAALIIFMYKKDKREKEPFKNLLGCFLFGVLSTIPAFIVEDFNIDILESDLVEGSVYYAVIDAFIAVALAEELFKYIALKIRTWKSKDFNCSFDGLVYAVTVSMGFATFENILYVAADGGGLETAVTRMFTAVPGHACDGVLMGYYYSKAKKASVHGNKREERRNKRKALIVPILAHGLYDFFLDITEEGAGEDVLLLCILLWFVYVAVLFIGSFKLINKMSRTDEPFLREEALSDRAEIPAAAAGANTVVVINWECGCGAINAGNYCTVCGAKRREAD